MASEDYDELYLEEECACDLDFSGSTGEFKVGAKNAQASLGVKYLLSHISLDLQAGKQGKILNELVPVREMFDFRDLDFDQIMQRDIDDSRVSSKLIPYILDDQSRDLVKFFPPIVVVALPCDERGQTLDYYPKVESGEENLQRLGPKKWQVTRSGAPGSEVFQFEQPLLQGKAQEHDLVRFRVNTDKCRLVIVDGQHRAMALLALYRNINKAQWDHKKRQPYQKYYQEWTQDYINQYDLSNISLPVIICTIPELDEGFDGEYDLHKAARSVFLTLNKNAQPVSKTRNLLLDDNDLVASFMRRTLREIKERDSHSPSSLRIHNIELDQANDKQVINSPVAIAGVSHLYYMIENMMMDNGDVRGVSARSGHFKKRETFDKGLERLGAHDLIGHEAYNDTKRTNFSEEVEETLSGAFFEIYGKKIIDVYERLEPYELHCRSVLALQKRLQNHQDRQLEPMLFAGQGMARVFENHKNELQRRYKENVYGAQTPEMGAIIEDLKSTQYRLQENVDQFRKERAQEFLKKIQDKNKLKLEGGDFSSEIVKIVNEKIFDNVLNTVAVQTAIVCGFFMEYEKASSEFGATSGLDLDLDVEWGSYLECINRFFSPNTYYKLKVLVSILVGQVTGDSAEEWKVAEQSSDSFRSVVYPGEMQPDQWPKYRYLFLELWEPEDKEFSERIREERSICRSHVFDSLYNRTKKEIAQDQRILLEDMGDSHKEQAFEKAYENFSAFLGWLGKKSEISKTMMRASLKDLDIHEQFTFADEESYEDL